MNTTTGFVTGDPPAAAGAALMNIFANMPKPAQMGGLINPANSMPGNGNGGGGNGKSSGGGGFMGVVSTYKWWLIGTVVVLVLATGCALYFVGRKHGGIAEQRYRDGSKSSAASAASAASASAATPSATDSSNSSSANSNTNNARGSKSNDEEQQQAKPAAANARNAATPSQYFQREARRAEVEAAAALAAQQQRALARSRQAPVNDGALLDDYF